MRTYERELLFRGFQVDMTVYYQSLPFVGVKISKVVGQVRKVQKGSDHRHRTRKASPVPVAEASREITC